MIDFWVQIRASCEKFNDDIKLFFYNWRAFATLWRMLYSILLTFFEPKNTAFKSEEPYKHKN